MAIPFLTTGPPFASLNSLPANVVTNRFGSFDVVPQPGDPLVPINYLTGPGRFSLNLRLSKSFGFGKKTEATEYSGRPWWRGRNVWTRPRRPGRAGWRRRISAVRGGGGPDAGATNHRYNLTFSVAARNIFNNVNLTTPIGNLGSPLFGQSNGIRRRFGPAVVAGPVAQPPIAKSICRCRLISKSHCCPQLRRNRPCKLLRLSSRT